MTGQEDYIYVWTLGVEGGGDGNDSIVTVGRQSGVGPLRQDRPPAPVAGQHEAHHARLHR